MGKSSFLENYDACEDTIRKLYDSRLRLAILDALKEGPLRLADLRREVNANAPNTSAKAKELETMGLLKRVGGDFQLTHHGKVTLQKISEEVQFFSTYEKLKGYWATRDISPIPDDLWARIGELNSCEFFKAKAPDLMLAHNQCLTIIDSPKKEFYGITPVFRPEYAEIAIKILSSGIHVEFILTDDVLKIVAQNSTPEIMSLFDDHSNHVLFSNNSVSLTLKVSEAWFFLALNSKTGQGDMMSMDIQSEDPSTRKWGLDLFNYYKSKSKPVKLKDYL